MCIYKKYISASTAKWDKRYFNNVARCAIHRTEPVTVQCEGWINEQMCQK